MGMLRIVLPLALLASNEGPGAVKVGSAEYLASVALSGANSAELVVLLVPDGDDDPVLQAAAASNGKSKATTARWRRLRMSCSFQRLWGDL